MNFDLDKATVFLTKAGSHAYGFATPESDYDYRGIAIPPMESYIGLKYSFENAISKDIYEHFPIGLFEDDPRNGSSKNNPDIQIFELRKLVRLALQNNPTILEILFTDSSDFIRCYPVMEPLLENRDKLLTKQCKARFCGYALSQLKRIKRHKRWLDNPPTHKPTRAEFGLPEKSLISVDQLGAAEALINKEVEEFMINQDDLPEHVKIELEQGLGRMMRAVWSAIHPGKVYPVDDSEGGWKGTRDVLAVGVGHQNFDDNFMEILRKEKKYRAIKAEWDHYQTWKAERNPKRAELEAKYGFDGKHASHLVRLIRCAREILEQGKVIVKRPDADELMAIRNGAWSYEQIVEFAEKEDIALQEVAKNSSLPTKPPVELFDGIIQEMIEKYNGRK